MTHRAITKCACGHRSCRDWHVQPEAWVQGVKFTMCQAECVMALLDWLDGALPDNRLQNILTYGKQLHTQARLSDENDEDKARS